jgi:hypothetical protein
MFALTDAENAALVVWTQQGSSRDTLLAAVRIAVEITERRYENSEDHRAALLGQTLAEIRDLAYRAGAAGAVDALTEIHRRASRALNREEN